MKREDIEFLKELQGRIKKDKESHIFNIDTLWTIVERVKLKEKDISNPDGVLIVGYFEEEEYYDIEDFYKNVKEALEDYPVKIELDDEDLKFKVSDGDEVVDEFIISLNDWRDEIQYGLDKINVLMSEFNYECFDYRIVNQYLPGALYFTEKAAQEFIDRNKKYLEDPVVVPVRGLCSDLRRIYEILVYTDLSKLEEENA